MKNKLLVSPPLPSSHKSLPLNENNYLSLSLLTYVMRPHLIRFNIKYFLEFNSVRLRLIAYFPLSLIFRINLIDLETMEAE